MSIHLSFVAVQVLLSPAPCRCWTASPYWGPVLTWRGSSRRWTLRLTLYHCHSHRHTVTPSDGETVTLSDRHTVILYSWPFSSRGRPSRGPSTLCRSGASLDRYSSQTKYLHRPNIHNIHRNCPACNPQHSCTKCQTCLPRDLHRWPYLLPATYSYLLPITSYLLPSLLPAGPRQGSVQLPARLLPGPRGGDHSGWHQQSPHTGGRGFHFTWFHLTPGLREERHLPLPVRDPRQGGGAALVPQEGRQCFLLNVLVLIMCWRMKFFFYIWANLFQCLTHKAESY